MRTKLYLNKTKRDYQPFINEAVQYFKDHGVTVSFDVEKSDFKSLFVVWGQIRGVAPAPNYDLTICLYELNDFPVSTGYTVDTGVGIVIYLPVHPFDDGNGFTNLNIKHEIMHALVYILKRKGIKVLDVMDSYRMNTEKDFEHPDSNFSEQWKLIEPYKALLGATSPVNDRSRVTLTRGASSKKQTLGTLIATNGGATFSCKTLELPWLENQSNVSCIPKGIYKVKWNFSPKYLRFMYEVTGVPKRSGIRFHSGNYFKDIQGCILLGSGLTDLNKDGELDVINSRLTVKAFEGFMGQKDFILEIK